LELDLLEESFQFYKGRFDSIYGGFGGAPKFPTPAHLKHLLRLPSYSPEVREVVGEKDCVYARGMALMTLECMAKGGIKDQIGHGFARYSVTRDWSLPHFEKMYVPPLVVSVFLVLTRCQALRQRPALTNLSRCIPRYQVTVVFRYGS
jgi:uncharacterized protein YyaL (SSP411 family)